MQLISDEYKKLNENLHENNKNYGTSGVYYLDGVIGLVRKYKTQDVLDYGCGKSTLAHNLPFTIKQYDPAIKKYAALPEPADIVVCTDVLEHIEPDMIDDVLKHISTLTKKIAYLSACTIEAKKKLPDGRNAHLIIKTHDEWISIFDKYFKVNDLLKTEDHLVALLEPKSLFEKLDEERRSLVYDWDKVKPENRKRFEEIQAKLLELEMGEKDKC